MTLRDWAEARSVLCVRLDTIGDVLMTTPAIRALKQQRPGRTISLLTSSVGAEAGCLVPEIDEVGIYDPPWMKATQVRADGDADRAMIERLRAQEFDAAVIFTVYSQSAQPAALLLALAEIPLRLAHCREKNPYGLLTDWVREPEPEKFIRHEVRRHLDLVDTIGAFTPDERLSLSPGPVAFARVRDAVRSAGPPTTPLVVVHPGASAPSRRYPAGRFGAAAGQLYEHTGARLVFTGTRAEAPLVAEAARVAGHGVPLAGRLQLDELAALIGMADVVLTNNTAPAHIASAMGTPVVDMYALTNPQHMPWQVPSRVLFHDTDCKYCYRSLCPLGHHRCLELVEPADVARAALELLDGRPRNVAPMQPRTQTAPAASAAGAVL